MENVTVTEYIGNYDDFTAYRAAHSQTGSDSSPTPINEEKERRVNDYKQRKEAAAAERKRLKQIENAERDIERMEAELTALNEQMSLPEISSDYGKIMELTKQSAEMQEKIDGLYALLAELYD